MVLLKLQNEEVFKFLCCTEIHSLYFVGSILFNKVMLLYIYSGFLVNEYIY